VWSLPQQQNNKRRITISQMQEQLSNPIFVTSLVLLYGYDMRLRRRWYLVRPLQRKKNRKERSSHV
jgi:hypothetical protein